MLRVDASGLALVVASGLFWLWASTRPLVDELERGDEDVKEGEPPALARP
jgi:hypothetical protein